MDTQVERNNVTMQDSVHGSFQPKGWELEMDWQLRHVVI